MRADDRFKGLDKGFWAHVRSLSQTLGYTDRGKGTIKIPTLPQILDGMEKLELHSNHLVSNGKPTALAETLISYFTYRAEVLNGTVQHQLMNKDEAKALYEHLLGDRNTSSPQR